MSRPGAGSRSWTSAKPFADGLVGVLGALHGLLGVPAGALLGAPVGVGRGDDHHLVAGAVEDRTLGDARLLHMGGAVALVRPGPVDLVVDEAGPVLLSVLLT